MFMPAEASRPDPSFRLDLIYWLKTLLMEEFLIHRALVLTIVLALIAVILALKLRSRAFD